nr:oxysterol-binding protein-related protein 1-like [Procambarus clarkii]
MVQWSSMQPALALVGGWTKLHSAAIDGNNTWVEELISEGANISAVSPSGETPLYYARKEGHRQVVETLLKWNADVRNISSTVQSSIRLARPACPPIRSVALNYFVPLILRQVGAIESHRSLAHKSQNQYSVL